MSRGGVYLASLLVTIGRPAWWLVTLAGFLVRGGFVVFFVPIVLLPSPIAISNVVAPLVIPVALGRIGPEAIAIFVATVALVSAWIIVGGWIAAITDIALIREAAAAAAEEGIGTVEPGPGSATPPADHVLVGRLLAARLVAWFPLAIATGLAIVGIISATYAELTRPADVGTPLVLRVAIGAAPELAIIGVAWLLGELVGGLAGRWIVLDGAPTRAALIGALGDVARRPAATLLPWLVTTGMLLVIIGGTVGASSIAWSRVIVALSDRPVDPPAVAVNLLLFVAIWLAALALAGMFAALRGTVQTIEYVHLRWATRTFGASAHHRPGDWSMPGEGGSL